MALPPLLLKIGADTRDLEQSVERVQSNLGGLQRTSDNVARGFNRAGDASMRLGRRMLPLSAGITAAAGGAFMLARNTANAGDEIAKSARAAGVSADDFQELRFAMGQVAGMSEGEFASALQYLNRQMGEAANGNERAAEALAAVGVSLEDVQDGTVDAADVMQMFSDNADQFATSADAAQVAAALFGRSGASLGPLLRESGDEVAGLRDRAQELGILLGGETLDASEEFNDKMDELQKQAAQTRAEIGQALLPVALALATAFQDRVLPALGGVVDGVTTAIKWFGDLPAPVQEAASVIATALGVGGPVLLAVGAMSKAIGALVLATGPIGLLIGAAALAAAAWVKWGDDIKDIMGSLFGVVAGPVQSVVALFKALGEDIQAAVGGALDWATDRFNDFLEFVASIPERFRDIGRAIMDGLREGINDAWEAVKASIQEKVDWLPDWVKDRLGIESPSRVFSEIGHNIGEGLAEGIRESTPLAQEAMKDMTEGLLGDDGDGNGDGEGMGEDSPMQNLIDRFREFGERTGQSFADGLRATMDLARQAVVDIGGDITSSAADMAAGVVGAMADMFKGSKPIAAAQALINTFQGITEALKLPYPESIRAAADVAARGFAAVQGIRSASPGGGGGGGGSAGRGGGAAPAPPTQRLRFEVVGEGPEQDAAFRTLQLVQEAIDSGGRLEGIVAERVSA